MCLFLKPQSQIDKVLLSPDQSVDRFRMRLSSGVGDLFTTKRFNDTKLTRWHCCFSLTPLPPTHALLPLSSRAPRFSQEGERQLPRHRWVSTCL